MSHDDRAADVLRKYLANTPLMQMHSDDLLDALSAAGLAVVRVGEPLTTDSVTMPRNVFELLTQRKPCRRCGYDPPDDALDLRPTEGRMEQQHDRGDLLWLNPRSKRPHYINQNRPVPDGYVPLYRLTEGDDR